MILEKWTTIIQQFDLQDKNLLLDACRYILAQELTKKKTTELASLKGGSGYHSEGDILADGLDWQNTLSFLFKQQSRQYLELVNEQPIEVKNEHLFTWAMVMRDGDYSSPHCHPGADVSGVFYLKVPSLEGYQGSISFLDPRNSAKSHQLYCGKNTTSITPQEGQGLVFPPWLDHYVNSHRTNNTRISLAFNYYINR